LENTNGSDPTTIESSKPKNGKDKKVAQKREREKEATNKEKE